jgi:hypothetical protein
MENLGMSSEILHTGSSSSYPVWELQLDTVPAVRAFNYENVESVPRLHGYYLQSQKQRRTMLVEGTFL